MAQVQMTKGKCSLPRVASLLFLLRVVFSLFFLCPDSTSVTVHAGAQQVYVSTEGGGDRSAPQSGSTKLANRNNINIVYNAEIKDISCCTKIWLCCHPCYCGSTFDKDRSYLYIRENSLEGNVATKSCLCGQKDFTFVDYFDRDPYKPSKHCLCIPTLPKLELMQGGCQICCVKVSVVSPGRLSLLLLLRVVRSPFLSLVRLLFGRFCGHYALRKMLLWCSLLQQPCWLL